MSNLRDATSHDKAHPDMADSDSTIAMSRFPRIVQHKESSVSDVDGTASVSEHLAPEPRDESTPSIGSLYTWSDAVSHNTHQIIPQHHDFDEEEPLGMK